MLQSNLCGCPPSPDGLKRESGVKPEQDRYCNCHKGRALFATGMQTGKAGAGGKSQETCPHSHGGLPRHPGASPGLFSEALWVCVMR